MKYVSRLGITAIVATSVWMAALPVHVKAAEPPNPLSASYPLPLYQQPTVVQESLPPLNMLVLGRDHKLYYEAYNDASDLNEDGLLDVGYRGDFQRWNPNASPPGFETVPEANRVTYYGLFDSLKCYIYGTDGVFTPTRITPNKRCGGSGEWSGDFLNYLTTSRIDALKKVLYGGTRSVDTTSRTVLERVRIPQDGHSWGKEYTGIAKDGYDIRNYTPYSVPTAAPPPAPTRRHLFASTSLNDDINTPRLRTLPNSIYRIWNWVSIEGPVAGEDCDPGSRRRCGEFAPADWTPVPASALNIQSFRTIATGTINALDGLAGNPASPNNRAEMDTLFATYDIPTRIIGSVPTAITSINTPSANGGAAQPFTSPDVRIVRPIDRYGTWVSGRLTVPRSGVWRFAVDSDETVDFRLRNPAGTVDLTFAAWYGSHGMCNGNNDAVTAANLAAMSVCAEVVNGTTRFFGSANLVAGEPYQFLFRHQEATGNDGYRLLWTDGQPVPVSVIEDRVARVAVCVSEALKEDNCLPYRNTVTNAITLKPTGLLHEFGETDRMFFGLMTGSFQNNTQGGVIRKNLGSFKDEINLADGTFKTTFRGIVDQLNRFRIRGYPQTLNRLSNSGYAGCGGIGWRPIANSECRDWGNPIGEMVYETMRYFGGATPLFGYAQANSWDNDLGLLQDPWKDPYAPTPAGLGFRACALPFATVISDINPSYDTDLPGSSFSSITPADPTFPTFNATALGQDMWTREGFGTKSIFIGESGAVADGVPSAKSASSFGNIRGLAPEEPTKAGSFYGAAAAYFGRNTDVQPTAAVPGLQNVQTFAVALTSPLPRIEFPITRNGATQTITLIPFAKSVAHPGQGVGSEFRIPQTPDFRPTNTIVDFYIADFVNMAGGRSDATVNGGRPFAEFRINYEDVEQGNDHDMDAIVRYTLQQTATGDLSVDLALEYQAGSVVHHMGYVISGTTRDGPYLEIVDENRNEDVRANDLGYQRYRFDTPPGKWSGECSVVTDCPRASATAVYTDQRTPLPRTLANDRLMPREATRVFSPGTGTTAELLKDPLWVMAKYGGSRRPAPISGPIPNVDWDEDNDGTPDNYFLVTNALTLAERLRSAFIAIENRANPAGSIATSSSRVDSDTLVYRSSFEFRRGTDQGWFGDIEARSLSPQGVVGDFPTWNAASQQPAASARRIFYWNRTNGAAEAFTSAVFGPAADVLRGRPMGDIVNSLAAVSSKQDFGYCAPPAILAASTLPASVKAARDTDCDKPAPGYDDFLNEKIPAPPTVPPAPRLIVGTNDGLLRVLNGLTGAEEAAFMPSSALDGLSIDPPSTDNWRTLTTSNYSNRHRYFVDGPVTVGDVKIGGAWSTVALAATGAGGRSIMAIRVSGRSGLAATDFLWEFRHPELGNALGQPKIARLNDGRFAAVFGNGVNSLYDRASLFVVDMATGTLIRKIDTGVGDSTPESSYAGRPGVYRFSMPIGPNGLSAPTPVDMSGARRDSDDISFGLDPDVYATGTFDGIADLVYAGDFRGNMWRFNIDSEDPNDWGVSFAGQPLFVTRNPLGGTGEIQPITSAPAVALHPISGLAVAFGTGRFDVNGDDFARPEYADSFYAIRDKNARVTTLGNVVQQNLVGNRIVSNTNVDEGADGWFIDFTGSFSLTGERVLAAGLIRQGAIFFNTFAPGVRATPCDPSPPPGGFLMILDLFTGIGRYEIIDPSAPPGTAGTALPPGSPKAPPTIVGGGGSRERPLDIFIRPDGTTVVLDTRRGRQSWRQLR